MWNVLLHGKEPIYNVGGNSRTTIRELAEKIGKYLDAPVILPSKIQDMAGAPEDVYLDMTKVQEEFNKIEYVILDEGLKNTIEWQRQLYAQIAGGAIRVKV
jgi:nucleoside-diphosphate-sugar epimerase